MDPIRLVSSPLLLVGLVFLLCGMRGIARAADDREANAVLDKAFKALGGEERLSKIKAATWKTRGTIDVGFGESESSSTTTVQGLDHFRTEFAAEFGGMKNYGVTVLAGDRGWQKFQELKDPMGESERAGARRMLYLQLIPITLVPLKDRSFKIKVAGEDKVGGRPAIGLKITGPDGHDFTLYFDRETGLPARQVAVVPGFRGMHHFTQETTFSDYREMDGIKKATRIKAKRDGANFLDQKVIEFRILDKVDPRTFSEPK